MKLKNQSREITGEGPVKVSHGTLNDKDIIDDVTLNGVREVFQPESVKMNEFRGQVAIVTGAASGIGLAISQKLIKEGASVALLDINETGLKTEFKKYKTKVRLFAIDITQQS